MNSAVVTRFAPSPTGRLHLGHAYSAMMAHDFARSRGGRFVLRIEDIDTGRCRPEFIDGIFDDLAWLGLTHDGPVLRQSERFSVYGHALDRLREMNLLYPCFCTRRDIAQSASAPHGPDGPIYPGTCRHLPDAMARLASEPHCWRIDMAAAVAIADPLDDDPLPHGDVVLARKDVPTSYHVSVVMDDAAQGITDIVRGEDLLPATAIHCLLQVLLDLPSPNYHHHRLLTDAGGRRLAKRDGAPALADLRAAGEDPAALLARLRAWA